MLSHKICLPHTRCLAVGPPLVLQVLRIFGRLFCSQALDTHTHTHEIPRIGCLSLILFSREASNQSGSQIVIGRSHHLPMIALNHTLPVCLNFTTWEAPTCQSSCNRPGSIQLWLHSPRRHFFWTHHPERLQKYRRKETAKPDLEKTYSNYHQLGSI